MKTKGLTWQEVLALSLETKVRLPWWNYKSYDSIKYMYFTRNDVNRIYFTMVSNDDTERAYTLLADDLVQDQWEIYEEPKKEREYMYGWEALKLVYGGKKVACDDEDWIRYYSFIYLGSGVLRIELDYQTLETAMSERNMSQKKWYVVEDDE